MTLALGEFVCVCYLDDQRPIVYMFNHSSLFGESVCFCVCVCFKTIYQLLDILSVLFIVVHLQSSIKSA